MEQTFKKPTRMILKTAPLIKELLPDELIKDLQENECVCPVCKGLGLRADNAPYGLKGDPDKNAMFPYKHQSFSFCQNCYNGVVNTCPHCHKVLVNKGTQCDCEGAANARKQEREQKDKDIFDKSTKISADDDIAKGMVMMYSDHYNYNEGYFANWEDFFDCWRDNHQDDEPIPEYVWGTVENKMSIDASNIIDSAVEDLHEDARDNISQWDENELQQMLDGWCEKQTGTTSYMQDSKYSIRIPWGDNNENVL